MESFRLKSCAAAVVLLVGCGVFFSGAIVQAATGVDDNAIREKAALIPYPQRIVWNGKLLSCEYFKIDVPTEITKKCGFSVAELYQVIMETGGRPAGGSGRQVVKVSLRYGQVRGAGDNNEAYHLEVGNNKISIIAPGEAGMFYAVQTLRQLIIKKDGRNYVAGCTIDDWPAFKIRGFMHDLGRNFQDVNLLKKFIDVMAEYKLNVFHMHLTDNPGYRIECIKYPQLNYPKNYRQTRRPGKFYTYAQLNDIIRYCKVRQITVIPEIDMPGHSEYFKHTFGFGMQDPRGVKILKDILNEFFDHVKTKYFHMGSDEVRVGNKAFMPIMAKLIRSRGRKLIVWRPGNMPDMPVITQLWSERTRPARVKGELVPYIDSRDNYINHMDPLIGPLRLFMQQPCSVVRGNDTALGGVICHWPDNNVGVQMNIYSQSPVMPALVTYAERIWRGSKVNELKYWAQMPRPGSKEFARFVDFENRLISNRDRFFNDWPFPYVRQTNIRWKVIGPFDNKGNSKASFPVEKVIKDSYIVNGRRYKWKDDIVGGTVYIHHFFGFPTAFSFKARQGTMYALSYVYSPREQKTGFWIGFTGYSRSGGRSGGPNPKQGQWSNCNAEVWFNDSVIAPPVWKHPGLANSREVPFTDENYYFRAPTMVNLNKGWNKILLKVPHNRPARKWFFTCVPVKWDSKHVREVPGLVFATKPTLGGR